MRLFLVLAAMAGFANSLSAIAEDAHPACPLAAHYCKAGPAERRFKLDFAPSAIQAAMTAQFKPQCETAMIQQMGRGAKTVAGAFCTCSVNAILATPGEWRVLHAAARMSPKDVSRMDAALATQTQSQEKGCMYAIAAGTHLIAPKTGTIPTPLSSEGASGASLGIGNSDSVGNHSGFSQILGQPYTPGN